MPDDAKGPGPQTVYAQAAGRPTDGLAIASLVLGSLGVAGAFFYFIPSLILGGLAVTLGLWSRSRIRRSAGALGGSGLATAGWIVGACAFAFACVGAVLFIGMMAAGRSG